MLILLYDQLAILDVTTHTVKITEGYLDAQNCCFGLIASKFNAFISDRLLAATIETLKEHGTIENNIEVVRVPGAFEIPLVARHLAHSRQFDAIICLGAVIRGETSHFEYISAEMSRGIAKTTWESGIPIIFGVLTTDTTEQALDRAGKIEKNRGVEAARTAIEMATLMKQLHSIDQKQTGFRGH